MAAKTVVPFVSDQDGASAPIPRPEIEQVTLSHIVGWTFALREELYRTMALTDPEAGAFMGIWRALDVIDHICERLPVVATALRSSNETSRRFMLRAEADLQTLLHALLLQEFDDVRPQEPTCSLAGGSARIDLFVRPVGIALEAKMATRNLREQKIVEQLLADIFWYRQHAECRAIYFYVYDPGGYIRSPTGLETDLEALAGREVIIRAAVRPRR